MDAFPYLFCTRCGGSRLTARTYRLFECQNCGFEHYLNPIVAVAAILSDSTGKILLIRRANNPGKGKLAVPGGIVDPGETAEEAVRREVLEEVNLRIDSIEYFVSFPNEYPYQGVNYPALDLFFIGAVASFKDARAMEEVRSIQYSAVNEIDLREIAFPSIARTLELYRDKNNRD